MSDMRLIVAGAGGRMGRTLIHAIAATDGASLVGAIDAPGSAVIGRDAGELAAGRERKRRLGLVLAGDDQRVEEVQPARHHPDQDLARSGDGVGDVREHEVVGRSESLAEDGFHGCAALV